MILPFVRDLLADLKASDAFTRAERHLAAGMGRRRVSGMTFTGRALYLPLFAAAGKDTPTLVLVADNKAAEALHGAVLATAELTGALDPKSIVRLPAHDVLPFENLSPHPEILETRAAALWKISSGTARLVIAPAESASLRLFGRDFYASLALRIKVGEEYLPETILEHLLTVGYTRVDVVEMPGQVTLRGGILDVYSPEADRPVRIDFFGDEVESIRRFDPETQRSQSPLDTALLLPLVEVPITERVLEAINARLTRSGAGAPGLDSETWAGIQLEGGETPRELQTHVSTRTGEATVFPGWEFFAPVAGARSTLLELMGPATRVLLEEPAMITNGGERWWNKVEQRHERAGIGNLIRPEDLYISPWELDDRIRGFPGLELDQLGAVDVLESDRSSGSEIEFHTRPTQRFHGSVPALVDQLKTLLASPDNRILLTAPNQGEVERLAGILGEYGLPYRLGSRQQAGGSETIFSEQSYLSGEASAPVIVRSPIANGVQILDLSEKWVPHSSTASSSKGGILSTASPSSSGTRQLIVFGANDLSDEADVTARPVTRKSKTSAFISDFRDLAVGDYVVHVEHGIAQYCGLRVLDETTENPLEMMILEFAEQAKLYVPLTRLDLIQKYRSTDTGPAPVLNRLGNPAWQKTKARVKKAMQDMAAELLKLYAQRRAAQGAAFSPDNNLQREFEDAFPYNETDDQLSAVADIKRDMESPQPMDRLLCGDVGYGKTEVAMRAAFKAVQDSRQVAVLTPTTVLCFQHFESFKRRFANFPVNVEMISRFRTPKEKAAVLEGAATGKVDVLIGTHAILGQSLKFQDLGLLIVDEEQRFGVKHKERLKQMRASIDVLAMSATPIPRTLHMSLLGLRDMSVIETPPKDRMAIQTIVAKFDEKLVRTAIEIELERGGQAYFVSNRVETIYEFAAKIRELVPSARVVIGHGQLPEAELERVMLAFMNHEYDVLVATSIIENGLDIPLANTIIINRADRHGLSELYQLRGRVGRSNRRAYAYLLIPGGNELTEIARRRLAALKEFSDLGAGFKIAALDLELRGAGNMLGGEQSGHIEAIGFELYTSMLEEAVTKMKGEDGKPEHGTTVLNLGISVRIDADYIAEENQRLRMYKRIAGALDQATIDDVRSELHDRYGAPPESVVNLLTAGELRLQCERLGIAQVDRKRTQIELPNPNGNKKQPLKQFVEMLNIRFHAPEEAPTLEKLAPSAARNLPQPSPGKSASKSTPPPAPAAPDLSKSKIDPATLMRLIARNAKRGAQFTPQGILRWPLTSSKAEDVLAETRELLDALTPGPSQ